MHIVVRRALQDMPIVVRRALQDGSCSHHLQLYEIKWFFLTDWYEILTQY